jgi:hypothetical protein
MISIGTSPARPDLLDDGTPEEEFSAGRTATRIVTNRRIWPMDRQKFTRTDVTPDEVPGAPSATESSRSSLYASASTTPDDRGSREFP